jgi:hypothetical protein
MQCGSELGDDVLFDDSGSATLDRRVVACVTRTRETTMGDRDGPGPARGPPGHVQQLPGITAVSAGQAQIRRLPAQLADLVQHPGNNRDPAAIRLRGDGETRTRTGDTTIFSRAIDSLERCRNPWKRWVLGRWTQRLEPRSLQSFAASSGDEVRLVSRSRRCWRRSVRQGCREGRKWGWYRVSDSATTGHLY